MHTVYIYIYIYTYILHAQFYRERSVQDIKYIRNFQLTFFISLFSDSPSSSSARLKLLSVKLNISIPETGKSLLLPHISYFTVFRTTREYFSKSDLLACHIRGYGGAFNNTNANDVIVVALLRLRAYLFSIHEALAVKMNRNKYLK